jgi:hypothetical protein
MQLILYGVMIAALFIIFLSLKKKARKQSVFKETINIISEIMREPDDLKEPENNDKE